MLIDEWHYSSGEHHGETIADVELSRRFREWLTTKHAPQNVHVPYPEFVFLDPSAASMRAQLHTDQITSWSADNTVLDGIADVANLLSQGKLIVTDKCVTFLAEVTEYEWDEKASDECRDEVVKRDDHAMDAAHYAIRSTIGQWQHEVYALAA